jgi:hypothetical protein
MSNEKEKKEDTIYKPFNNTAEGAKLYEGMNNAYNAFTGYGNPNWDKQKQADDLINSILKRKDFSYDFNADAIYQQFKDKYIQQGKLAMADAMGQAAALTGGYGNSYAGAVGNQAYQAHLNNLNDIIPDLYQMAYNRDKQEGQDLYNQYGLLMQDYDRYMNDYNTGYGKAKDAYDAASKAYYNSADLYGKNQDNSVGDSSSGGTSGGGSAVNTGNTATSDIRKKLEGMSSNTEIESYLERLEATDVISHKEALKLMAEFMDDNEVYVDTNDGGKAISYKGMIGSTQGWEVVDDGGWNLTGVDKNAMVKAPNGEMVRLDELQDILISEGMTKKDAKHAVKTLQQKLGISSNWLFGW